MNKNALSVPSASARLGDEYEDICSYFITLASSSSETHCNNLLHVKKKGVALLQNFQKKF